MPQSTVPVAFVRSPPILSSVLLLLSLPTVNAACTRDLNGTTSERRSLLPRSTSSGLSNAVILTIVGAALFFLFMGAILLFLFLRRRREHRKGCEHRERAWEYKDMQREGELPSWNSARPPISVSLPFTISEGMLVSEEMSVPVHPKRAHFV